MYKEPHLNEKSDECSRLWYKWFDLSQDPATRRSEECQEARRVWCQCADELGQMVHEAVDPEVFARLFKIRYNNSARVQEDEQS